MFNLKKNKSKLIYFLIIITVIFLWWKNKYTLNEYKLCGSCEGFDGHDGRFDMDDIEPERDSPFITETPPPPKTESDNPGKIGQPGDMSAIDWDPYIQKPPETAEQWAAEGVEGDGTKYMSKKYENKFTKIETEGVSNLEKEESSGNRKLLCNRPVSLVGVNAFNVCPALKNSTTCGNWDADWDYWCRKELGNGQTDEYSLENPSQEVWGRKYKYEGGCNNNPFNPWTAIAGGNGRAVCEKGWKQGKPLRPYSTSCQLWTDIGFSEFSQRMCTETYETARGPVENKKVSLGVKPKNPPDWKNPSQEIWGKASRYNGGCIIGQGRVQCGKGWSDGYKLVPFSTACQEPNTAGGGVGEIYGHQLNTDCARYNKVKCPDAGLTADKCWGVKQMYKGKGGCPDSLLDMRNGFISTGLALLGGGLVGGLIAGGSLANRKLRRAACGKGFYNGVKLPENTTPCLRWSTIDDIDCRYYAGGKIINVNKNGKIVKKRVPQSCNYSENNKPQDVWGVKKRIGYGDKVCNYGFGRAVCAKGYSGGVKVLPNSSNCYGWLDSADTMCRKTYGNGWIADFDAHKRFSQVGKNAKYNGGCPRTSLSFEDALAFTTKIFTFGALGSFGGNKTCTNRNNCTWGCGRAICKKDPTPVGGTKVAWFGTNGRTMGDTLAGTSECGSWVGFNKKYICQDAFGDNYQLVKQQGCSWIFGVKAICKRVR